MIVTLCGSHRGEGGTPIARWMRGARWWGKAFCAGLHGMEKLTNHRSTFKKYQQLICLIRIPNSFEVSKPNYIHDSVGCSTYRRPYRWNAKMHIYNNKNQCKTLNLSIQIILLRDLQEKLIVCSTSKQPRPSRV